MRQVGHLLKSVSSVPLSYDFGTISNVDRKQIHTHTHTQTRSLIFQVTRTLEMYVTNICSGPVNVQYTTKRTSRNGAIPCRTGYWASVSLNTWILNAFTWLEHGFAKAAVTTDHLPLYLLTVNVYALQIAGSNTEWLHKRKSRLCEK